MANDNLDLKINASLNMDPAIKDAKVGSEKLEKAIEIRGDKVLANMQDALNNLLELSESQFEALKKRVVIIKEAERYTANRVRLEAKQLELEEAILDRERLRADVAAQIKHTKSLVERGSAQGWIRRSQEQEATLITHFEEADAKVRELNGSIVRLKGTLASMESRDVSHTFEIDMSKGQAELETFKQTQQDIRDATNAIIERAELIPQTFIDASDEIKDFFSEFLSNTSSLTERLDWLENEARELQVAFTTIDSSTPVDELESMARRATALASSFASTAREITSLGNSFESQDLNDEQLDHVSFVLDGMNHRISTILGQLNALPQAIAVPAKVADTNLENRRAALEQSIKLLDEFIAKSNEREGSLVNQAALKLLTAYKQELLKLPEVQEKVNKTSPFATNRIAQIKARQKELRDMIKEIEAGTYEAKQGEDITETWTNACIEVAKLTREMNAYHDAVKRALNAMQDFKLGELFDIDKSWRYIIQLMGYAQRALNKLATEANKVKNALIKMVVGAIPALLKLAKTIKNSIVSAFNKLRSSVNSIKSTVKKLSSGLTKAFSPKGLKSSLNTLIKYTFGVRSLYFLYKKLRTAVAEGLKNLVQYESATNQTNKAITQLNTSLLYLKNAWAAAFAPIINFVMPWLTSLLDTIARVGNAIARFVAALTGQATVLQAVRTFAGDYADSLKDAGSSAGGAAKKTKQLTDRLADFDDLDVLGKDKDPSSSGSGGGGGASDAFTPDINDMFTKITTPFNKLADMLKNGEWFNLGVALEQQLSKGLEDAYTWLTGKGKKLIMKIANGIGDFLDGFLSDSSLGERIGKVLDAAITVALEFLNTVVTPDRVMKIGAIIANALSRASNVLPLIGETIGNLILSAIAGFYGFATKFDYAKFAKNFSEAISKFFDKLSMQYAKGSSKTGWDMLGEALSSTFDGFITILTRLFNENSGAISDAFNQIWNAIDIDEEAVGSLVSKIIDTIKNKIQAKLEELMNSKEFNEFLGKLKLVGTVVGVIVGAVSVVAGILTVLSKVFGIITSIVGAVFTLASIIGGGSVAAGFTTLIGAIAGLTPILSTIGIVIGAIVGSVLLLVKDFIILGIWVVALVEHFLRVKKCIDDIIALNKQVWDDIGNGTISWDNLLEDLADGWEGLFGDAGTLKENFDGFISWISEGFDDFIDLITGKWGSGDSTEASTESGTVTGSIISPFAKMGTTLLDMWDGDASDLEERFNQFKSDASETFEGLKSTVLRIFSTMKESLKTPINGIISVINSLISGVVTGINTLIKALNKFEINFPDWVPNIGGKTFKFNLSTLNAPQIPKLAQGAVIPPNKEFMAVLGDQKSGTNIEAPLETIKQAVAEELSAQISVLQEGFSDVVNAINRKELAIGDKEIGKANARYTAQQRLIRGTSI